MKKRLFQKSGVDICSPKSMFEFICGHFKYWTMNSWNKLTSIANKVKLYDLELDGDWHTALAYLNDLNDMGGIQAEINDMIYAWEKDHPGYALYFNGRSGGYLVIHNKGWRGYTNNGSILPDSLDHKSYEDFKSYVKYYGWTLKDMMPELREYTKLIRDFDKLCDEIREVVNDYSLMNYDEDKELEIQAVLTELDEKYPQFKRS